MVGDRLHCRAAGAEDTIQVTLASLAATPFGG